jgi:hypothetical protein
VARVVLQKWASMKQFEMALSTADKKSRWQKVYYLKVGLCNSKQTSYKSIGQLLDDTIAKMC